MRRIGERAITVGGMGKTFAVTGWRLGYVVAPTPLSAAVRPVHDSLTVCAPAPLQHAAVAALNLPELLRSDDGRLPSAAGGDDAHPGEERGNYRQFKEDAYRYE